MSGTLESENLAGRKDARPRSVDRAMQSTSHTGDESTGTTRRTDDDTHRDLIATSEDRVIDANAVYTRHFENAGVVVFAATFERTEHGLRWNGDAPIFAAAVESEQAIRETLAGAGYRSHDVERALDADHRLTDSRADAAARAAGGRVVATDGGQEAR